MSLADYTPPKREVKLTSDNSCFVQGLSLESLAILLQHHLPDMEQIFDLFQVGGNLDADGLKKIGTALATQAPGLTANIIALAANETNAIEIARTIPGPKQIEILTVIGELTFEEVGGVKKFVETVASLLAQTNLNTKIQQAMLTSRKPV